MTASIRWRGVVRRLITLSSAMVLGTAVLSAVALPAHAHGLAPAIAAPDLQNGYSYNEQASKSPDFAGMFADIKKVFGYIQDVVMVVGAL